MTIRIWQSVPNSYRRLVASVYNLDSVSSDEYSIYGMVNGICVFVHSYQRGAFGISIEVDVEENVIPALEVDVPALYHDVEKTYDEYFTISTPAR